MFFDNIDKLIESDLKESFSHLIDDIRKNCSNVSVLFCPCDIINVQKSFERICLGPLEKIHILQIMYLMAETQNEWEHKEGSCYSEQETYAHLFKKENQYFTPENRESMEEIASLCNGHPGAAILAGSLLTEDCGLLTPAELIEMIKTIRSKVHHSGDSLLTSNTGDCDSPMHQLELIYKEILHEDIKLLNIITK